MGYKFQFITLAGFHALNYSMFELAHGYARNMSAFVELQQAEFAAAEKGFTAVKHQREVGTGYFDEITTVVTAGKASTSAARLDRGRAVLRLAERKHEARHGVDHAFQDRPPILEGFDRHYRLFREAAIDAKGPCTSAQLGARCRRSRAAHPDVRPRVDEAVARLPSAIPEAETEESLWPAIKAAYIDLIEDKQPECAETFYNSVACAVLHRRYYNNEFIFWRPARSHRAPRGRERRPTGAITPAQRLDRSSSTRPPELRPLERVPGSRGISIYPPRHRGAFPPTRGAANPNSRSRSLVAFLPQQGCVRRRPGINGAITSCRSRCRCCRTKRGALYLDTLLVDEGPSSSCSSRCARVFLVDMEVPCGYVSFLAGSCRASRRPRCTCRRPAEAGQDALLPRSATAPQALERPLRARARDEGMVMLVFTLPSFPYVFKVIRDRFAPPKDLDRRRSEGSTHAS